MHRKVSGNLVADQSICFVMISLYISKRSSHLSISASESRNNLFGVIADGFTNILNIHLFKAYSYEVERFSRNVHAHVLKEKGLLRYLLKIGFLQGIFVTLFSTFILILLLYFKFENYISVGDFTFILIASSTIIRNIYSISSDLSQSTKEIGSFIKAIRVFELIPDIQEARTAASLKVGDGNIELINVTFSHSDNQPILNKINLTIRGKKRTGIVGSSGAGKTTFINLLTRIYNIHSGQIIIDGQDIQSVTLTSLREVICVVPQEPLLFNRSIFENIHIAKPSSTFQEVVEAAQKSQCHEFISAFPDGYDTLVGERGIKLSGGQRQRITLARAFLKNPPIIILDEPTSALDPNTESKLKGCFDLLFHNKTVIIVSHKASTLKNLDDVLIFKDGNIIESTSIHGIDSAYSIEEALSS